MQSYYIKPKAFYDSFGDVQPSQPYSYTYGDRPTFEFAFLPNEIAEGDTLVFAVDNDMVFYDSEPENILHSASCMVVVRHDVTADEATAGKVQMRIETRTLKFRDVVNGKVRPVEVISGLYRRRGSDDDINYVLLARGRAFANGIIADYDTLPEPITTDEYYTKDEINDRLSEKADEATLVAHTDDATIHVTQQEKTEWSNKADRNDIGNATVTITQGGTSKGSFSVNASENVTIEVNDGAQADWNETDTTSPSYIQHKPSVYTKTETDGLLDAKADRSSVYTKTETDGLLDAKANVATTISGYGIQDAYTKNETDGLLDAKADRSTTYTKTEMDALLDAKADKATTIAGYGITDAYTKTEIDAKVSSVYHYNGTVSAYADLPASGQKIGDVWNIETADSAHGIKAGDNVAWTGTEWDVLAGEIDLSAYATKTELETKLDAPVAGTVGQVLTKTADGQEWADAPAGGGGEDTTDYLCFTAEQANSTVRLDKVGTPPTISLEYSTDKMNWTEYTWDGTTGATITLANVGDKVWWRGNNETISNSPYWHTFKIVGNIEASGNIMSLLDKSCKSVTITTAYCFHNLFYYCSSLTKAPELPATTIAEGCYNSMFAGCSSLTKAPELPATTIAEGCYSSMFSSCSSLTKAPELPATKLANSCYSSMFYYCSSLTKAPELPATKLAINCYNSMFAYCSKLNRVKVSFTSWVNNVDWLTNASTTGVFQCPSALDCSTRDTKHVPAGWTIVRTDSPKSITSPTTASSEATYQVSPNTPSVPVVTVSSALTLNANPVDSGSITYAEIVLDVASGATVTAGSNLTLVDTPTAGMRNICVVRWSNGVAKLYVTIVEDLPQA